MDLELNGRVALVTGGTQGIGLATAERLLREGAKVVIAARDGERVAAVVSSLSALGVVEGVAADVTRGDDCERLVAETSRRLGGLDILVNNAGTAAAAPFETIGDEAWQADLDLKLFAAVRLIRLAAPVMRKQRHGRIVNVTSIGGKAPAAKSLPSTVSRAAGLALTKALSKEYAPDGILVNAVCIGSVRSAQQDAKAHAKGLTPETYYVELAREVPLGRVGRPEEAANVIAFLCSGAASFITGTSINIDGGAASAL